LIGAIGLRERWLTSAVYGAPLTLIAAAIMGLRAALLLPTNLRAAWIFQLTEESDSRRHQLNAVKQTLLGFGVAGPAVLAFPVQAGVLGLRSALACLPVVILLGWIVVELTIRHWRRVPFTCTVLFGKRPAAYTLLLIVLAFNVFALVGTGLQRVAISRPASWAIVLSILFL